LPESRQNTQFIDTLRPAKGGITKGALLDSQVFTQQCPLLTGLLLILF
jgi:hypothetical protein